jgi:hypothetical protein
MFSNAMMLLEALASSSAFFRACSIELICKEAQRAWMATSRNEGRWRLL